MGGRTGSGRDLRHAGRNPAVSPPGGGQTAYVNTWAFGPLAPGKTRALAWYVVPVKPGLWTVHYSVAPGLAGKSKARLPSSRLVNGTFLAHIASAPPLTHVNPNTGHVEVGPAPRLAAQRPGDPPFGRLSKDRALRFRHSVIAFGELVLRFLRLRTLGAGDPWEFVQSYDG